MIDEEYPTTARNFRLHARDDSKSCGGIGAVRSLARWDLASLVGVNVVNARVRFTYTTDFGQYAGGSRTVGIHEVNSAWNGQTTWSTSPSWSMTPLATQSLVNTPGSTVTFPVPASLVNQWISNPSLSRGLLLRFSAEACASPRWPAEFDRYPMLDVNCP